METSTLQISLKQQVTDETISSGTAGSFALICLADPHYFQFVLLDTKRTKFIALRDYRLSQATNSLYTEGFFSQVFEQDDLLKTMRPGKVIVAVNSSDTVLVPEPLFSKENSIDVLQLTSRVPDDHNVYDDKLKLAPIHQVYSVPQSLLSETGSFFNEAFLVNARSAFTDAMLLMYKHHKEPVLSVNVRPEAMDVVAVTGGSLLFANTFTYHNGEDFIYYLLFVLEQLQLNPDQTSVHLYGDLEKTSSAWMVSRKYIRNLSFGDRPESVSFSYGFEKLNAHQYFFLFTQHLCVS